MIDTEFTNKILYGDCLNIMPLIPDQSVDMILCDLPYGTTRCKWDTLIPLAPLWKEYKRVCKGAIVLTCTQPFTSVLIVSNINEYKHSWVWDKVTGIGHLVSKRRPLQQTEDIAVFGKRIKYNPQMIDRPSDKVIKSHAREGARTEMMGGNKSNLPPKVYDTWYPKNILRYSKTSRKDILHPTQKPLGLFEYLIKTYSDEGDTILDNCIGSGTTALAAMNTNRKFHRDRKRQTLLRSGV